MTDPTDPAAPASRPAASWLERQRSLLDFTLASLWRRKGKNLSLLAVYALVVFALASVLLLSESLRAEARAVLAEAPDVVVQRMAAGRHELMPGDRIEKLAAIRGVRGAVGRRWGYYFDRGSEANFTVMVPEAFWGTEGQVVVGEGVARARAVERGRAFPMKGADGSYLNLTVREVIPAASAGVTSDLVLLSEADYARLFGLPADRFTDIALVVPNAKEVATVAEKVTKLYPDARPITRDEIGRTYEAIFDWRSGLIVVILSAAVLAFALVAWDKAAGLSAEERREIGILKAIGWETSDVLAVKLFEGAVVSFSAFALGWLAAYGHLYVTDAPLFEPVLRGWSTLSPARRLDPAVGGLEVLTLFVLTVVPYTVATVVPAWRASTTDPDAVMRA
jgi:ABC-type lipoprotein release transport system permease subunit